jgi:hypothetical protein
MDFLLLHFTASVGHLSMQCSLFGKMPTHTLISPVCRIVVLQAVVIICVVAAKNSKEDALLIRYFTKLLWIFRLSAHVWLLAVIVMI